MTTPFRLIRSTGAPRSKKKNVRPDSPRQQKARLGVEWLEERAVPATFTVNSLQDVSNALDGLMTLREAIDAANGTQEADTIKFAPGLAGTISLSLPGVNEDDNKGGDLDIRGSVTIEGPGASAITVNQTIGDRVFDVLAAKGATVNISGLTLSGGNVTADGGGVRSMGGADVSLSALEIIGNTAAGTGAGGGVATANGSLALVGSTLADNTAAKGGGLQVFSGQAEVKDSTISSNTATDSGGGVNVSNSSGNGVQIHNSTITGNNAPPTQGAGINVSGGSVTLTSAVVTGNVANDVTGAVQTVGQTSMSANPSALLPGTVLSTGIGSPTAVASFLNPTLGPLANERGPALVNQAPVENSSVTAASRSASDARSTARIVRSPLDVPLADSGRAVEQLRQDRTQPVPSLSPVTPAPSPTQGPVVDPAVQSSGINPVETLVATVMNMIAHDGARAGVSVVAFMDVDGDGVKEVVLALSGAGGDQTIVVLNGTTGAPVFFLPSGAAGAR